MCALFSDFNNKIIREINFDKRAKKLVQVATRRIKALENNEKNFAIVRLRIRFLILKWLTAEGHNLMWLWDLVIPCTWPQLNL